MNYQCRFSWKNNNKKKYLMGDILHEISKLSFWEKYFKMSPAEMFTKHAKLQVGGFWFSKLHFLSGVKHVKCDTNLLQLFVQVLYLYNLLVVRKLAVSHAHRRSDQHANLCSLIWIFVPVYAKMYNLAWITNKYLSQNLHPCILFRAP